MPAEKITVRFNRKAKLSILEERTQGIVAVVGPIACELCSIKCRDAYVGIASEDSVAMLKRRGVRAIETPVSLPLPSMLRGIEVAIDKNKENKPGKVVKKTEPAPLFGPRKSSEKRVSEQAQYFGGWNARMINQIVDYALDLHAAAVVTPNQDGSLELHDFFQDELACGPLATPEQPTTPVEIFEVDPSRHTNESDGKHRMF